MGLFLQVTFYCHAISMWTISNTFTSRQKYSNTVCIVDSIRVIPRKTQATQVTEQKTSSRNERLYTGLCLTNGTFQLRSEETLRLTSFHYVSVFVLTHSQSRIPNISQRKILWTWTAENEVQGNDELGEKNRHVPSTDSIANDSSNGRGSSSKSSDGMTIMPDVDDVVDIFISEPPTNGCAGQI